VHPFYFSKKELIFIADYNNKRQNNQNNNKDLINDAIRFPQVLLIGPDGEQLGVMSSREAQMKANSYDLDLLCVAPQAKPPVCKIINYSKFRFEQQKKIKAAKKNQHVVEVKEVQLTPQIGIHDIETKVRAATKFLEAGNKVKVGVRFRGRQMTHIEVGQEVMDKFISMVSELCTIEKQPSMDGRWLVAILAPKKK
jgi:translation initiation factor IF-3